MLMRALPAAVAAEAPEAVVSSGALQRVLLCDEVRYVLQLLLWSQARPEEADDLLHQVCK